MCWSWTLATSRSYTRVASWASSRVDVGVAVPAPSRSEPVPAAGASSDGGRCQEAAFLVAVNVEVPSARGQESVVNGLGDVDVGLQVALLVEVLVGGGNELGVA